MSAASSDQRQVYKVLCFAPSWRVIAFLIIGLFPLSATADRYVDASNPAPQAPFTNWLTAATAIQDAIDVATNGDVVWVTNGIYSSGGRPVVGIMTNRVTIDKPIRVTSVNGPEYTIIVGGGSAGGSNGVDSVRCAWIAAGAVLDGFTLKNGHTLMSGDVVTNRSGGGAWCAASDSVVSNCAFVDNGAYTYGAGLYGGSAFSCVFSGNRVGDYGGGAAWAALADCLFTNNFSGSRGGAVYNATLDRCHLIDNTATAGGGAHGGYLDRCTLTGNRAAGSGAMGGGVVSGAVCNSHIYGNSTSGDGGGAYASALTNCSVIGNLASVKGGGVRRSALINSIVYYNHAPASQTNENHDGGTFAYSCTVPLPPGEGNIESGPMVAGIDNPNLLAASPCRDVGIALANLGPFDFDGEERIVGIGPDMGCDEFAALAQTGHIALGVGEAGRSQGTGIAIDFEALSRGRATSLQWDFGDGEAATNECAVRHVYASPGVYRIRLRAVNDEETADVEMVLSIVGEAFVSPTGDDAGAGTNWATAKASIQAAVDACMPSGAVVRVTNGVYAAGGRAMGGILTNRVVLDRPVTVVSVGGAQATVILGMTSPTSGGLGDGAMRCLWMTNGTAVVGFTLSNGYTRVTSNAAPDACGGAVWCASASCVVSQCVIEGNAAHADGGGVLGGTLAECTVRLNRAQRGGGVASNTAANCLFAKNLATGEGGGTFASLLTHCSVLANRATTAGGIWGGGATNSIVYFNTCSARAENYAAASLAWSCAQPLPAGPSNIDRDPGLWGIANPRLMPSSSCIDAGSNVRSTGAFDLEGGRRLDGLAVDMGCDEFGASSQEGWLTASILAPWAELAADYEMSFMADTAGPAMFIGWDFGDGATTSGAVSVRHAFAAPGSYEVRMVSSNLTGIASSVMTVRVERAERFVSPFGDDLAPGTNWASARATLQGGVDACVLPGTLVWVTNGVYATGGRPSAGSMTNRLAIDQPVRVFSANGPASTIVVGVRSAVALDGCSADSVRCVWATNNVILAGFTLSNGFTTADTVATNERSGGGAWCASRSVILSNCLIRGCGARFSGGGVYQGTLVECEISSCAATNGGATADSQIEECLVVSNKADYGAGAYASDSSNSVFRANTARVQGGGLFGGVHQVPQVYGNVATNGGGAYSADLRSGIVVGNMAGGMGGGAHSCTQDRCLLKDNGAGAGGGAYRGLLYNSALVGNRAATNGGGARSALLANCTVISNCAPVGPGTFTSTQLNSIVYFNVTTNGVRQDYSGGVFEYSCTTPIPAGTGNITNSPGVAGVNNPYLLSGSPCIDAGTSDYVSGLRDLVGKPRVTGPLVDIGCDEFAEGWASGPVRGVASAEWAGWAAGQSGNFRAATTGVVSRLTWDFMDGVQVTNDAAPGHAFARSGTYNVRLIASNDGAAWTSFVQVVIGMSPLYVSPFGSDSRIGTNWATAKATIQAAIDASSIAGTVWVTGGVYSAGGRIMDGTLSNRVAIPRYMFVRSVHGPQFTFIVGTASPTNNGLGAESVRCAWLTNGAVLAGFTLTNGCTRYVNQTWSPEEIGGGAFGSSAEAVISNCIFRGNRATRGGGAGNVSVYDSTFVTNQAVLYGGAAYYSSLSNCSVSWNSAGGYGGGVSRSRVESCRLVANRAGSYGGMDTSTSFWCTVVGNVAGLCGGGAGDSCATGDLSASNTAGYGGGAYGGVMSNCFVHSNIATSLLGGGVHSSSVIGCTVISNQGGGSYSSIARNSILYYNIGENFILTGSGSSYNNCTRGYASSFTGSISNEPMFAGYLNPHLLPNSPCIDAGTNLAAQSALDFDGEMRTNGANVDIGCDEFWWSGCTGAIAIAVSSSWTNVAPGYPVVVDATAEGRITGLAPSAPGGVLLTNAVRRYSFSFPSVGLFPVTVVASNTIGVVSAQLSVIVSTQAWFVAPGGSDSAPGTNWTTAKATLQAAVDGYPTLGGTIWVTNGTYARGGRVVGASLSNRVALLRPVTMRSVNGSAGTFIRGGYCPTNMANGPGAVRCAWLSSGTSLVGFTLTNGFTDATGDTITNQSGGGAFCSSESLLSLCRVSGCSAYWVGGGVYGGLLRNCVFYLNFSKYPGGAAAGATLSACTVVSNQSADSNQGSGGLYSCVATNCAFHANLPGPGPLGGYVNSSVVASMTTNPLFASMIDGDFHILRNSPCIDAGIVEPWMLGSLDFDGKPRVIGGTADCGAYEYTSGTTASGVPWEWLMLHSLATDGTADDQDADGDGMSARAEYRARTNPLDPSSFLGLKSVQYAMDGGSMFPVIRWASSTGVLYRVEVGTNLVEGFTAVLSDDISPTPPENVITDRTDNASSMRAYRVNVK